MNSSRIMGLDVSTAFSSFSKFAELPLQQGFRELRTGYQSISELLEQSLSECDLRAAELAVCRQQLIAAQERLTDRDERLAQRSQAEAEARGRCTALQQRLDAAQSQLAELQLQASQVQGEAAQCRQRLDLQNEYGQQLHVQINRLESECEASRVESARLRAESVALADATADATRLRGELATAQMELARARNEIGTAPQSADLRDELSAAQAEREQMESELELLRNRGAELTEALAEQKRAIAKQHEQWNDELRQLRRAVERQSDLLVQSPIPAADSPDASPTELPIARTSPSAQGDDLVVESVLEQFAQLQKNKVRKLTGSSP